jgi:hypothetical protein
VSDDIRREQFNKRLKEFQVNFVDEELPEYISLALSEEDFPPVRRPTDEGVIFLSGVVESIDACVPDGHADAEREKIIPAIKKAHQLEARKRFPGLVESDPTVIPFILSEPDVEVSVPTGSEAYHE